MTFAHVNSFDTGNPVTLDRQLTQLEDNISAECNSIRLQTLAVPKLLSFVAVASAVSNRVLFSFPSQLSVDSNSASLTIVFPPLTASFFGQRFTLLRRSALNNVVCACLDISVRCNGSTTWPTFTGATPRVLEFYCDASGYFYQ